MVMGEFKESPNAEKETPPETEPKPVVLEVVTAPEQADKIARYDHLNYDDYLDLYLKGQDKFAESNHLNFDKYGLRPALTHSKIEYKKEISIGERAVIETLIIGIGQDSITYRQIIKVKGEIASSSETSVKLIDIESERNSSIPKEIRQMLLANNPNIKEKEQVPAHQEIPARTGKEKVIEFDIKVSSPQADRNGNLSYRRYLEFYQIGHLAFLRSAGLDFQKLEERYGIKMFAVNVDVFWNSEASLGEKIKTETYISRLGKSSMDFQQAITRDGEIISTAKVTVVFVNKEGKPSAIPEIVRQKSVTTN